MAVLVFADQQKQVYVKGIRAAWLKKLAAPEREI